MRVVATLSLLILLAPTTLAHHEEPPEDPNDGPGDFTTYNCIMYMQGFICHYAGDAIEDYDEPSREQAMHEAYATLDYHRDELHAAPWKIIDNFGDVCAKVPEIRNNGETVICVDIICPESNTPDGQPQPRLPTLPFTEPNEYDRCKAPVSAFMEAICHDINSDRHYWLTKCRESVHHFHDATRSAQEDPWTYMMQESIGNMATDGEKAACYLGYWFWTIEHAAPLTSYCTSQGYPRPTGNMYGPQ